MNKTTKSILSGIGMFIGAAVLVIGIRCLIKGSTIGNEMKDWVNWLVCVVSGCSYGYSVWKKETEKEGKKN